MAKEEIIVGGYRRINILQTGQNSEVWEVAEIGGKQRYAMKLLLTDRPIEPQQRAAMKVEAKIGLSLQHPHCIRFYKFVNDRHMPFILMECFRGSNAKVPIMKGELERIRPLLRRMLMQFSDALHYFHEKGWVHKDIKPDNLLFNQAGETRLIDFAIAVRATSSLAKLFWRKKRQASGTRSYMSPEQIRGEPLDRRADIYSAGIMFFELVAGRPPYTANSGNELLKKHLQSGVPILSPDTGVDGSFADLVRRMMAKKPSDRPATMEDILAEMRRIKLYADESADSA
ncbi:serine/threonine protein kinase [bacterium]|nr:serine/threonine protein kinase [bacterium]